MEFMLLDDDKNDASSGDFSTLHSYSPSTVSSGVSTSVMTSLNNSNNSVAGARHDDHDGHDHAHAPNEISAAGVTWSSAAGPVSSDPYYINALKSGAVWANNGISLNLNYKFWTALPSYYGAGAQEAQNFQQFTASMKTATIQILGNISNIINVTFTQVSSDASAQLGFAQAKLTAGAGAWAYYPGSYGQAGDVWTNNMYAASTQNVGLGTYGYQTLIHEIGHALGLKHSFEAPGALPGAEDSSRYSVMSYTWPFYAESFMLYDIAALQKLYGANLNYATGNNTYTLSSGHAYTIWDAGGVDTMDGSALGSNLTIDLNEGKHSSVGLTQNVAIAFGVEMENAVGGSGNDTIYGNVLDNNIQGGNGNDTIYGSAGDDTLNGGAGADTVVYNYSVYDFLIDLVDNTTVTMTHNALGTTTLTDFENFTFSNASLSLAELSQYVSGAAGSVGIDIIIGTTRRSFDSLVSGNRNVTNNDLGIRGTAVAMYNIDRPDDDSLTINVLSTKASGKLELEARNGGGEVTLTGIHKAMAVLFTGRAGADTFISSATITGNDTLRGGGGNDTFSAGNGNDYLYGDAGNDALHGEIGNDIIYGGADNDTVTGGLGNDYLYGESGDDNLNGGDGNNVIYGGDGNDAITGGTGVDKIYCDTGDDTVNSGAGNDIIYGGIGNDNLSGGLGNDYLYGEAGDDILNGGDGNNIIYGADGNDTVTAGTGIDKIYVDIGNDTVDSGAGNDIVYGGLGNDSLSGGLGNDALYGEAGDDILNGGDGNNTAYGGDGDDTLTGGIGLDKLYGDAGNDTISGGAGNDTIGGGLGNDTLNGEDGNDTIVAGDGSDTLNGGAGLDKLTGEAGDDILRGGDGNDTLIAGIGNDILYGDAGNDALAGDAGNDLLVGGAGLDTLTGGIGVDIFGLTVLDGLIDVFKDFVHTGIDADKINITDILSGYDALTDNINDFVRLATITNRGATLMINHDGAGADWVKAATITGSSFVGATVDSLVASGQLITNQTLA
jgi:Ca2+-binding RTX toxin-like protein